MSEPSETQIENINTWSDAQIETLPIERGFRLRGLETTRLDTLIDAAFAFTLTVLVIAEGRFPQTFDELVDGMKLIPALAISFAVLMMFWMSHRNWSRRYGIENTYSVIVSIALVFTLLIYVYPLRLIFEGMISGLTYGYFEWNLKFTGYDQVRGMFVFYSTGFLAMAFLMSELYRVAGKARQALNLNDYERTHTKAKYDEWRIACGFSLLSIFLAAVVPNRLVPLAGYIYFLMWGVQWIYARRAKRQLAAQIEPVTPRR